MWAEVNGSPPEGIEEVVADRRKPPGQRIGRTIAAVAVAAVFVALAVVAASTFSDRVAAASPPPVSASPVSLWLSAERVAPGPIELVAILVNHEGVDVTFGVRAEVDRWDGDEWIPHGELVMCMDYWHCTARIQPPGGSDAVPAIGLGPQLGSPGPVERFTTDGLQVGWYRISQTANEGTVAAAVLEVAEDAPTPAPLVPIDAPAISVTPALVSRGGGEVQLYPLIPAPSGSQSRTDIERAIQDLSETAQIERWTGLAWEVVGSEELQDGGGDDIARSVVLPPLPAGEYRLVRERTKVPHIANFWVEDDRAA
jgi:hypothetical protein